VCGAASPLDRPEEEVLGRLLPQAPPHLATLDLRGVRIQARAVGGDYYETFLAEAAGLRDGEVPRMSAAWNQSSSPLRAFNNTS
jgi:hypothetical protein